ncbi:phosphorelay sensor kinase [Aureococcus anophagefferens]|nr:phosphorelay sensor kinase [Aureococcus anophagefferens]
MIDEAKGMDGDDSHDDEPGVVVPEGVELVPPTTPPAQISGSSGTPRKTWRSSRSPSVHLKRMATNVSKTINSTQTVAQAMSAQASLRVAHVQRGVGLNWGRYNDTAWFVIDPEARWRAVWDGGTAILLLYLVFAVPYSIAFLDGGLGWFEWFVLAWFSLDILISFVTPYEKAGLYVTNPRWIAFEYCRTYFAIDFLSTFPFDVVVNSTDSNMAVTGKALKLPRLAKTLRALKMSKLMKFYQVDELLGQVQINFHISPAFINLLALVFAALVINHFFACVWYTIGLRKFDDDCADGDGNRGRRHCTWMQTGGYSPRDGNWYLYTTCLYWSLSTVSTVGYGDISANTTMEKVYTIVVMITGVAGYAMMLQSIGRLMQSHSSTATTSTIALRDYLYKRNVPMDLCTKIFDYLYRHNAIRAYNNDNSQEVVASINELPKPIRRRLRLYTERATIGAIPWFQHRSSDFAADAVGFLKPTLSARGEVVGAQGIRAEALFFVQSGDLALEEEEAEGIRPLLRFGPGDNFGAPGCFVDAVWKLEIIACSDCEISVFPREHLRRLLDEPEHAHLLPQFEYEAHQTVQAAPFLYAFQDPAHQHGVARHAGDFRSPLGAARRDDGAAGRDNRAAKTALDVARSDSAVAVANFLREHVPAAALASGAPGADVVNGLIALGDYHEHHWTSAMDATTADAKVDATPPPLCGVGCGGPFGDDGDGGYM